MVTVCPQVEYTTYIGLISLNCQRHYFTDFKYFNKYINEAIHIFIVFCVGRSKSLTDYYIV